MLATNQRPRSTASLAADLEGRLRTTTPLVAPVKPMDESNPLLTFEFAKLINGSTTDYIRLADQKAAILITLLSANLLVMVQRAGEFISQNHSIPKLVPVLFACLYAVTSLGVAVNVLRPRLFRNARHGHVFWEDISAQSKERYAHSFQQLTMTEIFRELGEHNHNLSKSAIRKFRWLRIGFGMVLVSIVVSACAILMTSN